MLNTVQFEVVFEGASEVKPARCCTSARDLQLRIQMYRSLHRPVQATKESP